MIVLAICLMVVGIIVIELCDAKHDIPAHNRELKRILTQPPRVQATAQNPEPPKAGWEVKHDALFANRK